MSYRPERGVSGLVVAGLHAVALLVALDQAPIRRAIAEAAPLQVSIVPDTAPRPQLPSRSQPAPHLAPVARESVPLPEIAVAQAAPSITAPSAAAPVASPAPAAVARAVPPPATAPVFDANYLDNPAPAYPSLSRRLNEEGQVLLRVRVTAEGRAERVEVARSSGFERLDRSARAAVARWRFVPAREGERPVAAWVLVPVRFVLRG